MGTKYYIYTIRTSARKNNAEHHFYTTGTLRHVAWSAQKKNPGHYCMYQNITKNMVEHRLYTIVGSEEHRFKHCRISHGTPKKFRRLRKIKIKIRTNIVHTPARMQNKLLHARTYTWSLAPCHHVLCSPWKPAASDSAHCINVPQNTIYARQTNMVWNSFFNFTQIQRNGPC